MNKNYWIIAIAALSFASCKPSQNDQSNSNVIDELSLHIDSTLKPGDDYFMFANGKWFKDNPIPASERSNGIFRTIADSVNAAILNICETSSAQSKTEKGSNEQKIGDFYFSGMDTSAIEKAGIEALRLEMDAIEKVNSFDDVVAFASRLHAISSSPLISFYIGSDDKISSKNAVFVWQGGLSLPDREYYFTKDARSVTIREEFAKHMQSMFKLAGFDDSKASSASKDIMSIETTLASASRKMEDLRDPFANYNKTPLTDFEKNSPAVNWNLFLKGVGLTNVDTLIVGQPEFIAQLNKSSKQYSIDQWKNYLTWHLISNLSPYLSSAFDQEHFRFFGAVLNGTKEQRPRWKRVVEQTDNQLGELIGQVYVRDYLPKGTKEKLQEIGTAVKEVYKDRINKLDWMSDVTKQKAQVKLDAIIMKVGYPDKWKDMSALEVSRDSYVKNVMNANQWEFNYMINKYGKPVDRSEWGMTPQTYNAYYNPSNNEIVVPACNIIVPGYEKTMADDAILYSIIGGSTFGHEFTHGFDDQGRNYDEKGNLNNWWTAEDSTRFAQKTQAIVKQYSEFLVIDSLYINGENTLGENIADIGGINMGWEAFRKTNQYKQNKIIAGLNPSQRFFLGYAYAWMVNMRDEAMTMRVRTDVHSPAKFRVVGPLVNMPDFYSTFDIKQSDKIYRPDSLRVNIW